MSRIEDSIKESFPTDAQIKNSDPLYAAASDMYEVCKYLSTERNPNIYIAMDMAMKAFTKARGESRDYDEPSEEQKGGVNWTGDL